MGYLGWVKGLNKGSKGSVHSLRDPPMEPSSAEDINLNDPKVRAMIVRQYDKFGERWTKREYGVDRHRVGRWKELKTSKGSFAPCFAERGKHPALAPKDVKKLEAELTSNPYLSNRELSAKIKGKVSGRQVGRVIAKSTLEFRSKLEQVDVEMSFSPEIFKEGKAFMKKTHNIPYGDRVYMDETFASAGITRRKGRFPRKKKPWTKRNRKYPRMVIAGAITKDGFLHKSKIWNKGSITDDDFDTYVSKTLAPNLRAGHVVFWDQYGKFGRAKNPTSRHFSVKARKAIEKRGGKVIMLPRYGKHFDPIELIFGDTKRNYDKLLRESLRSTTPSKLKFGDKVKLWYEAEKQVDPKSFRRAFKERASGKEFLRVGKEKGLD